MAQSPCDGLPFGDVLSAETLSAALSTIEGGWIVRIYTPMVTLWVFLGQVLSADHSCRAAVARLLVHRIANGESRCSAETGGYCQARKRLPEAFFSEAVRETGRSLDAQIKPEWLWKGRRVRMFDGSTVTMPDTAANQAEYPQTSRSKPGAGFPIARLGVISSLCSGAVLNLGFCPYAGKGTGEVTLLRRLWDVLVEGDVLLAIACSAIGGVFTRRSNAAWPWSLDSTRPCGKRTSVRASDSERTTTWCVGPSPTSVGLVARRN
ncbi:hypothetical protein [Pirellulimonas nuda]|uniref:hypothetical protein n=1 Tax=Pirellulimonas nuda TaxID=2528009 RepID=UPI0018D3457A|nr:hypothetical protein [Pirellulimonas nuda]